ncbi:MAG: hypothetical protein ABI980_03230 [Nitrospirota bacterium]
MKCAIMSGGSGMLLSVLLCWPVGAVEIGGRVTLPEVDLVAVVTRNLQSPLFLPMPAMGPGSSCRRAAWNDSGHRAGDPSG